MRVSKLLTLLLQRVHVLSKKKRVQFKLIKIFIRINTTSIKIRGELSVILRFFFLLQ